jgi:hypothetical protein
MKEFMEERKKQIIKERRDVVRFNAYFTEHPADVNIKKKNLTSLLNKKWHSLHSETIQRAPLDKTTI